MHHVRVSEPEFRRWEEAAEARTVTVSQLTRWALSKARTAANDTLPDEPPGPHRVVFKLHCRSEDRDQWSEVAHRCGVSLSSLIRRLNTQLANDILEQ